MNKVFNIVKYIFISVIILIMLSLIMTSITLMKLNVIFFSLTLLLLSITLFIICLFIGNKKTKLVLKLVSFLIFILSTIFLTYRYNSLEKINGFEDKDLNKDTYRYAMNEKLYIMSDYNIEYIESDIDYVEITTYYYRDYEEVLVQEYIDSINVYHYQVLPDYLTILIEDIKENKLRNYTNLSAYKVEVRANKENIDVLLSNYNKENN